MVSLRNKCEIIRDILLLIINTDIKYKSFTEWMDGWMDGGWMEDP